MNPLTYISNISRNNVSNADIVINNDFKSPEIIALGVFLIIYIIARLIENFVNPFIPSFMTTEISSLFRWGSVLVPIIFGMTYLSKKPIKSDDKTLKKRIMFWKK